MNLWRRLLGPLVVAYLDATMPRMADRFNSRNAKGRRNVSVSHFNAMTQRAIANGRAESVLGYSPGYVATLLGITRQAVHAAIERGDLTAHFVHDDTTGSLCSIYVTDASVAEYRAKRETPGYERYTHTA